MTSPQSPARKVLSDADIEEILAASERATKGPYDYAPARRGEITTIHQVERAAATPPIRTDGPEFAYTCGGGEEQQNADAAYLCLAANNIPDALRELQSRRALDDERARLEAALRVVLDQINAVTGSTAHGLMVYLSDAEIAEIRAALAKGDDNG